MQTPLCSVCTQTPELLCPGCTAKMSSGHISHHDVELSRLLAKLEDKYKVLKYSSFKKVYDTGSRMVVVVPKDTASNIIGKGGVIAKEMESAFQKKVKIIEETDTAEGVIRAMIPRVEVIGVNKIFSAAGEKERVRLPKKYSGRIDIKELLEIIKLCTSRDVEIVFE